MATLDNYVNIVSGNGLSPVRRQAITWTSLTNYKLESYEQSSVQCASNYKHLLSRNLILKYHL